MVCLAYCSVGAAEWLDFTVIGPAVNLVSRLEATAKTLNPAIVRTADFARAYRRSLTSLGHYRLRGLTKPHELFVRACATQPGASLFISDRGLCTQDHQASGCLNQGALSRAQKETPIACS